MDGTTNANDATLHFDTSRRWIKWVLGIFAGKAVQGER
jgi:hypothetical protein